MGTHPIFESDFDCLTVLNSDIMSTSHLQWAIINKFSAFDIKRAGRTWTKEPGHLNGRKSLRFNTLVEQRGLKVSANAEGGVNFSADKLNTTMKKSSRKTFKSIRNVAKQGAFRKDQTRAAVKKASAVLASQASCSEVKSSFFSANRQ